MNFEPDSMAPDIFSCIAGLLLAGLLRKVSLPGMLKLAKAGWGGRLGGRM
jgi:hypothetical protein